MLGAFSLWCCGREGISQSFPVEWIIYISHARSYSFLTPHSYQLTPFHFPFFLLSQASQTMWLWMLFALPHIQSLIYSSRVFIQPLEAHHSCQAYQKPPCCPIQGTCSCLILLCFVAGFHWDDHSFPLSELFTWHPVHSPGFIFTFMAESFSFPHL